MSPLAKTILATVEAEPGQWTQRMLADDLEVTIGAVEHAIRSLRERGRLLRFRHASRSTEHRQARAARARKMWADGATRAAIRAELRVEPDTLRRYLSGLGRRGEKATAILACLRDAPGLTASEVAAHVGASVRRVRQVAREHSLQRRLIET